MKGDNAIYTAKRQRYYCAGCGSELVFDDRLGWRCCKCGETYEIVTTGDAGRGADIDYSEDVFVKAVLTVCDLSWEDVIGSSRTRCAVMAREMISDYLYNTKWLTLWRVGEVLGGRTNATIYSLNAAFERDWQRDRRFQALYSEVRRLTDDKA